jgi:hypothetical protein
MITEIRHALREARYLRKQLLAAVEMIEQQNQVTLMMARNYADLAVAWRLSMEQPEIDLRDDLDELIRTSLDEIAKLEEQVIV